MCEPISWSMVGWGAAALAAGSYIGNKITSAQQSAAQAASAASTPPTPTTVATPAPQASTPTQPTRTPPSAVELKKANTAKTATGVNANATMLTGTGGVDVSSLNIGKNTLLGS